MSPQLYQHRCLITMWTSKHQSQDSLLLPINFSMRVPVSILPEPQCVAM